jgi:hypothetical protein
MVVLLIGFVVTLLGGGMVLRLTIGSETPLGRWARERIEGVADLADFAELALEVAPQAFVETAGQAARLVFDLAVEIARMAPDAVGCFLDLGGAGLGLLGQGLGAAVEGAGHLLGFLFECLGGLSL